MAVISKNCISCGKEYQVHHSKKLRSKYCSRACQAKNIGKTHGLCQTRLFKKWSDMRARCYNPRHKSFKNYGGRGIKVCDRWQDFKNFYDDVGEIPFKGAHLDRINNDGDYEPGNVRWVTNQENAQNTRRNHRVIIDGKSMCLAEACRQLGVRFNFIASRKDRFNITAQQAVDFTITTQLARFSGYELQRQLQDFLDQQSS